MMQQYTVAALILGVIAVVFLSHSTTASVISCPPNNPQEASPNLRQLCAAIDQVIRESTPEQYYMGNERLDERNAKRQDVDHVFLRFGRRFGF